MFDKYADFALLVQGNNELSREALPAGDTITLKNGKKMVRPFFDFYNYSGINRSVHLITLPEERIEDYTTDFTLAGADADVHYTVTTTGDHDVVAVLRDADGQVVAENIGKQGTLHVTDAHLWNVRAAYLYTLTLRITNDTTIVDEYSAEIGIILC